MRAAGKLGALILAAGYSSRAPGFKPLLPVGGDTVAECAVALFRRAGITDITVVTGHRADDLAPLLSRLPVRPVFNPRFDEGMFSSVVAGVTSLRRETEAFFLLPVDMPLVSSHTVRLLSRAYRRSAADVVYPVFQGLRGHPPLISVRLAPAILAWNGRGGLRPLLAQYESGACDLDLTDEGVVLDIDTAADYREVIGRRYFRPAPSDNECVAIMARVRTPDMAVKHGRLVAAVARRLGERLNEAGLGLDVRLISAAGLLHDLAKGRPDHARKGARLLKGMGYPEVAAIVGSHSDIAFAEEQTVDEAAVVYLADKLVKEDRIIAVDERFRCQAARFAADPEALAAIGGRLAKTRIIARRVESLLGTGLEQEAGEAYRQHAPGKQPEADVWGLAR